MLLRRPGVPEEGELTLCTVTSIQYNSVFVRLEEYGLQGMIHISEISAGRIRNIRDFVTEGKVIICKVLRIDKERGHIDLSLRRVSEGARREKSSELKQEQKAEKIIELLAHELKLDPKELYEKISIPLLKDYQYTYHAFDLLSKDEISMDQLSIPAEYRESLIKVIKEKIKPRVIEITGQVNLQTYETDGLSQIKLLLGNLASKYSDLSMKYSGGGKYLLHITDTDFKVAEKKLKDVTTMLEEQSKAKKMTFSFERTA